jgi:nucleoside-diphosphate-sugar epimerase
VSGPVLVTGGAGSVGRLVVRRLREAGDAVRVFDLPGMDYAGLEGEEGIEVMQGDLTRADSVEAAVQGASAVVHLAALLPPASEQSRDRTFAVNVEGTARIAKALKGANPGAHFVFSSSVSTYGDTTAAGQPVTVDHPQHALDIYAESKIAAERLLQESYPGASILRISGISVPAVQSPPDVWPFMADQRIEFIHRDDVVTALCAAVQAEEAEGQVFNIAGGSTWRVRGQDYVKDYYDLLGAPIEEAHYQEHPGWCDWYDTRESQRILRYQNTTYRSYIDQIQREIDRTMQE